MERTIVNLILIALVLVAAYTDIRHGKIYNALTLPAIVIGLGLNGIFGGSEGLIQSAGAAAVAFGLLIIPVALRGVGAGDLKLMVAVGALLGGIQLLWLVFFYSALVLGAAAAVIVGCRYLALIPLPISTAWKFAKLKSLPYAPGIALGCAAVLFVR